MNKGAQLGLVAALAAIAYSGEPGLHRDGPFWVEIAKGSEPVALHGNIRISTVGAVTIRGGAGSELTYEVIKRAKARNDAEAGRLLSAYRIKVSHQGQWTYLVVQGGSEMADLKVTAPQNAGEVVIETRAGAVDAAQFSGVVKVESGGGRLSLDLMGGDVVAKTAAGEIVLGKIGGNCRCVSGAGTIRADNIHGEAFLETGAGDISVQQVDGAVRCSTNGGGIHIAQAGNLVIADTAGGVIDVGYAKGMVTANNAAGGPIQVGSAMGAKCESAGGGIRLTSAGGSLNASTTVGSIIARFQSQPAADSFLSTSAGDITVWIPSNLKITIRARNASYGGPQRIVSEFPDVPVKAIGFATIAEGALNGGGPLVRIAGTGGMIYLRREQK
ncbi:MAG TPA: DUF4097 family beta strand repeat-containing protein [Bryobacteraceae bacterium]|nr:DUF4097 family beta strand repeat-containing protein [Bryobacteraceae bacterium]